MPRQWLDKIAHRQPGRRWRRRRRRRRWRRRRRRRTSKSDSNSKSGSSSHDSKHSSNSCSGTSSSKSGSSQSKRRGTSTSVGRREEWEGGRRWGRWRGGRWWRPCGQIPDEVQDFINEERQLVRLEGSARLDVNEKTPVEGLLLPYLYHILYQYHQKYLAVLAVQEGMGDNPEMQAEHGGNPGYRAFTIAPICSIKRHFMTLDTRAAVSSVIS
ncbi:hypothetical protein VYU27_006805 [Nannochloropsis oceanica]